jgi:putative cardiolipin synthase
MHAVMVRYLGVAAGALLLTGCALPSLHERIPSSALQHTEATRLGRAVEPPQAAHPQQSGLYPRAAAAEAFAARAVLAGAAERSIDAQYYIWQADRTGLLLFEAICRAADRGVRVRLLLDDNTTAGLDPTLATLATHKNIEVRLFNPLLNRRARWSNYLFDFDRLNHRMHNKSFTVDNQVTIVGGRNIGDEYFHGGSSEAYCDLDMLAIGPVVRAVSDEFDLFWNSASAYPAGPVVGDPAKGAAEHLEERFAATHADPTAEQYLEAARKTQLVTDLARGNLPLEWTEARLVYDDPAKALGNEDRENLLLGRLIGTTIPPSTQFDLVSAYFVPRGQGTERLTALAKRGVQVRILTNSLESQDVLPVHAGYKKHRKALLRAHVKLYELERRQLPERERKAGIHSATGLHAKTFQIDGKTAFVGSFNFDPRSAKLNTEMGLVIDSPSLAHQIASFFDSQVGSLAYEVRLDRDSNLEWIQSTPQGPRVYDSEPGVSTWRRMQVWLLSILPIDGLL